MIRSVLDLTRELERLGVIEIVPQPGGGDCYRIIGKASHFRHRLPAGELAKRAGAIFRRKRTTVWSTEEWKAYRQLMIDPEDLRLVEEYYASEAGKENSYCRTTLLTFLRHYPGEVDRARRWKEASGRRHCY